MSDVLFTVPDSAVLPPGEKLSADRRRTQIQMERIALGIHPLVAVTYVRMHPDAPKDRDSPGPRCGTCWYRTSWHWHNRTYAKCTADDGARVTHGAASDVRAWWPACVDYSPGEQGLSADAARYIPDGAS